jgi:hypothetical protein
MYKKLHYSVFESSPDTGAQDRMLEEIMFNPGRGSASRDGTLVWEGTYGKLVQRFAGVVQKKILDICPDSGLRSEIWGLAGSVRGPPAADEDATRWTRLCGPLCESHFEELHTFSLQKPFFRSHLSKRNAVSPSQLSKLQTNRQVKLQANRKIALLVRVPKRPDLFGSLPDICIAIVFRFLLAEAPLVGESVDENVSNFEVRGMFLESRPPWFWQRSIPQSEFANRFVFIHRVLRPLCRRFRAVADSADVTSPILLSSNDRANKCMWRPRDEESGRQPAYIEARDNDSFAPIAGPTSMQICLRKLRKTQVLVLADIYCGGTNDWSGCLAELAQCVALQKLRISQSQRSRNQLWPPVPPQMASISDALGLHGGFASLSQLVTLELVGVSIAPAVAASISACTRLENLRIQSFEDLQNDDEPQQYSPDLALAPLSQCKTLKRLAIYAVPRFTDAGIRNLLSGSLGSLTALHLCGNAQYFAEAVDAPGGIINIIPLISNRCPLLRTLELDPGADLGLPDGTYSFIHPADISAVTRLKYLKHLHLWLSHQPSVNLMGATYHDFFEFTVFEGRGHARADYANVLQTVVESDWFENMMADALEDILQGELKHSGITRETFLLWENDDACRKKHGLITYRRLDRIAACSRRTIHLLDFWCFAPLLTQEMPTHLQTYLVCLLLMPPILRAPDLKGLLSWSATTVNRLQSQAPDMISVLTDIYLRTDMDHPHQVIVRECAAAILDACLGVVQWVHKVFMAGLAGKEYEEVTCDPEDDAEVQMRATINTSLAAAGEIARTNGADMQDQETAHVLVTNATATMQRSLLGTVCTDETMRQLLAQIVDLPSWQKDRAKLLQKLFNVGLQAMEDTPAKMEFITSQCIMLLKSLDEKLSQGRYVLFRELFHLLKTAQREQVAAEHDFLHTLLKVAKRQAESKTFKYGSEAYAANSWLLDETTIVPLICSKGVRSSSSVKTIVNSTDDLYAGVKEQLSYGHNVRLVVSLAGSDFIADGSGHISDGRLSQVGWLFPHWSGFRALQRTRRTGVRCYEVERLMIREGEVAYLPNKCCGYSSQLDDASDTDAIDGLSFHRGCFNSVLLASLVACIPRAAAAVADKLLAASIVSSAQAWVSVAPR